MPYRSPADPRTRLPLLDRVTVPTQCVAKWEEMVGDDAARFCCTCSKTVYDLSAMDRVDAEAFVARYLDAEASEMPCVRFYRRPDGRMLTSECGPAARRRHAKRASKTIAAALATTVVAAAAFDVATRPTLAADEPWPETVATENVRVLHLGGMVLHDHSDSDEDLPVRIDEVAIAEQLEPESEVLGTSARTVRAIEERGPKPDRIIEGHISLVTGDSPRPAYRLR
ncbi:MAG: hypothetical protein U0270_46450 [Labilithrix sp.]